MSNLTQKNILLVEDEVIISMAQAQIIGDFGYKVFTASSGEKAVQHIEKDTTISLVLMDIDLGSGINGPESARQILALRNIPIVFLTSHSEKEYVDKVKAITRYGYVIKNSGNFVLQSSIEMAYELFEAHERIEKNMTALQKSEERFRHLSDLLPQTVFETDITGNLTFVNQFGLKLFGYSHEDIESGLNIFSLIAPDDLKRVRKRIIEITNGSDTSANEYSVIRKNGEIFPAILHASAIIENGKSSGLRGIAIDITERKRSEKKLMESQALYSTLVDQLPAGVFRKDREGRYVFVSSWFCRLKKMKAEDFLGKLPEEIAKIEASRHGSEELAVKYAAAGSDHHKLIMQTKQTIEYEEVYIDADGKKQYVYAKKTPVFDSDKNIIGTQGILFDITERKLTEETMQVSETRLKESQEMAQVGNWEFDISTGLIWGSDTAFKVYGMKPAPKNELDINIIESCIPEKIKVHQALVDLINDDTAYNLEFTINPADGSPPRIIHSIARCIRNENGNPLRITGVIQDITEQKRTEDALYQKIIALSKPLDDPEGIRFSDLFNVEDIQRIQNEFAEATNVASIITNPDGTPITKPSNFCRLCKEIIRNTEKGIHNCFKSDAEIGRQNPDGPIVQPCLSGGLWDAGTSITIGGKHIANWLIGQVRNDDLDESQMIEYAEAIGADKNEFKKALSEVPVMSKEQFTKVAKSLFSFAKELSIIAYQNIQQARFISDHKNAEEKIKALLAEKELFIREIHHRIKNNMSTVVSLLSLQASTLKDPAAVEALEVSKNRVKSMMLLYDKLYRSVNFKEMSIKDYIPQLIDEIIGNFSIRVNIKVEKYIDDFILDARVFLPLGIIVNELITNAMKYSFAGRERGLIRISASKCIYNTVIIEDNGIGLPESIDTNNTTGFGLKLVGMLTQQIGGTIKIERNNGTKFILEFK
jgi:PAS domain S-box-containing protein